MVDVVMLVSMAGPRVTRAAGETVTVDDAEALRLFGAGFARPAAPAAPPAVEASMTTVEVAATTGAPERAVTAIPRGRRATLRR